MAQVESSKSAEAAAGLEVIPTRQSLSSGSGDPIVVAALALGWELADLYASRDASSSAPELPTTLPGVQGLTARETAHASLMRVRSLIRLALAPEVADAIKVPSAAVLGELPEGDGPAWAQSLYDLHVELCGALGAAGDGPLHGYDLGRSLGEICRDPSDLSALMVRLETARVLPVQARLADLAQMISAKIPSSVG